MTYPKQVPAVERALRLLEALAAAPNGLTAGELEAALNISRSSLFALLNTLKARNYIEQRDNRGPYRIGPAMLALMPGHQHALAPLIEAFHADVDAAALQETVALTRLDGVETVVIAKREAARAVRVVLELGQRRPAITSADGQVLLAGLAASEGIANLGDAASPAFDARAVQERGYAQTEDAETIDIAYPICADGYRPIAALLLTFPRFREWSRERVHETLRRIAVRLSHRMGAPVYRPYGRPVVETVEPTTPLGQDELEGFLRGAWGARLACVRPNGAPHVVPLWYEWDGRQVWITASPQSNWSEYIRRNAWVSLTIDEPWPPLRRALIIGRAEPVADEDIPGGVAGLRRRLEQRYLGQSRALGGNGSPQEWRAFRIVPQKIIGQRGLGRPDKDTSEVSSEDTDRKKHR